MSAPSRRYTPLNSRASTRTSKSSWQNLSRTSRCWVWENTGGRFLEQRWRMGIMGKPRAFRRGGKAGGTVTAVLKALKTAHRLGRFTNLQSAFFPVIPGKEYDFLLHNVTHGKDSLSKGERGQSDDLARNRRTNEVGHESHPGRGERAWIPSIPMGAVSSVTRADQLLATT